MKDNVDVTGDFGKLAKTYDIGRRGVPEEVLEFFWSLRTKNSPYILDVACGTGLITRQLVEKGATIVGTDIDSGMISVANAKENNPHNITYITAPAHKLPFNSETFDVITISSAFHWFSNLESATEMKRVLASNGLIFIFNKNDVGDFTGFRDIIKTFTVNGLIERKIEIVVWYGFK